MIRAKRKYQIKLGDEMNSTDDELIDIQDRRVPAAIREHAQRFRKVARYVCDLGDGEYLIYADDGELLDKLFADFFLPNCQLPNCLTLDLVFMRGQAVSGQQDLRCAI